MKLSNLAVQEPPEVSQQKILFPAGLVGFPDFTEAEIIYQPEQLPFMWLRGAGENAPSFIIVEPRGLIEDYEIELSDADSQALDLKSTDEALILNIATLRKGKTDAITLNLIGPIIVNRRSLAARQVVIANCQKYSARHLLFETPAPTPAT